MTGIERSEQSVSAHGYIIVRGQQPLLLIWDHENGRIPCAPKELQNAVLLPVTFSAGDQKCFSGAQTNRRDSPSRWQEQFVKCASPVANGTRNFRCLFSVCAPFLHQIISLFSHRALHATVQQHKFIGLLLNTGA